MAPEMDQFYRSTMAIYKVSMWRPGQVWRTGLLQGQGRAQAAGALGSRAWAGWAEQWARGWAFLEPSATPPDRTPRRTGPRPSRAVAGQRAEKLSQEMAVPMGGSWPPSVGKGDSLSLSFSFLSYFISGGCRRCHRHLLSTCCVQGPFPCEPHFTLPVK